MIQSGEECDNSIVLEAKMYANIAIHHMLDAASSYPFTLMSVGDLHDTNHLLAEIILKHKMFYFVGEPGKGCSIRLGE